MVAVLKVENIDPRSTPGEIRKLFKDHGSRPENIHVAARGTGKRSGCAFLIFNELNDADNALRVDGTLLKDGRISVRSSNPKQFDKFFPGISMIPKANNYPKDTRSGSAGVLKLENIDLDATLGDIRRFFKDHGARPEDIHLVLDSDVGKHSGCAFLIFNDLEETENALKLKGMIFRDRRISVKRSSPKEFDRYFPRVPMITKSVARGRGRSRGMVGGPGMTDRNNPRSIPNLEGRNNGNRSNSMAQLGGRGRSLRGIGRGGISRRGSGRFSNDHFYQNGRGQINLGRDRSPISAGRRDDTRESFARNYSGEQPLPYNSRRESIERRRDFRGHRSIGFPGSPLFDEAPLPNINERKFLRIYGLPANASEVDIQDFFRPVLTRDIYIMRNPGGKGKFNGSAVVEFFSESDARQAIKMDGKKFGRHVMSVIRPGKEDIERTIQESASSNGRSTLIPAPGFHDFSAINSVAQNNPQVQHLLNLLTVTVNTIAGAAVAQSKPENKREYRNERPERSSRDDPVVSRVATSADIDVSDIKLGRVVGIRNLPFSVTPDEILKFFQGYHAISDSVRIHYLEDGRCSGDAIICFRGNRDARKAVSDLNKGTLGRRKVELFFL